MMIIAKNRIYKNLFLVKFTFFELCFFGLAGQYSLFKIRSAKHYSQLTNGNHEKSFLRVAIGRLALIFCTSYFEQPIGDK